MLPLIGFLQQHCHGDAYDGLQVEDVGLEGDEGILVVGYAELGLWTEVTVVVVQALVRGENIEMCTCQSLWDFVFSPPRRQMAIFCSWPW